jgi:superfamily I DNA/RNA helicase
VQSEAFELEVLTLAYAITIHKSQGSEFPAVIVPVLNSHHIMLQRNLLYTAITRVRRLVVPAGDPKAIAVAVRKDKVLRRYTALAARLRQLACGQDATWFGVSSRRASSCAACLMDCQSSATSGPSAWAWASRYASSNVSASIGSASRYWNTSIS